MKFNILFRRFHFWISLAIILPIFTVIASGLLLQIKKEVEWVQPSTQSGEQAVSAATLPIELQQVLTIVKLIPEANVQSWQDINRLDIRPDKGVVKVRTQSSWEVQIDAHSGEVLHSAYRRSDLIESIHDGSFFHENARLWLFFPAALGLLILSLTGLYMLVITLRNKHRSKLRKLKSAQ